MSDMNIRGTASGSVQPQGAVANNPGREKLRADLVNCIAMFIERCREKGQCNGFQGSEEKFFQRHIVWTEGAFSDFKAEPHVQSYFKFISERFPQTKTAFYRALSAKLSYSPTKYDDPTQKTAANIIDGMEQVAIKEKPELYRSFTDRFIKENYGAAEKSPQVKAKAAAGKIFNTVYSVLMQRECKIKDRAFTYDEIQEITAETVGQLIVSSDPEVSVLREIGLEKTGKIIDSLTQHIWTKFLNDITLLEKVTQVRASGTTIKEMFLKGIYQDYREECLKELEAIISPRSKKTLKLKSTKKPVLKWGTTRLSRRKLGRNGAKYVEELRMFKRSKFKLKRLGK